MSVVGAAVTRHCLTPRQPNSLSDNVTYYEVYEFMCVCVCIHCYNVRTCFTRYRVKQLKVRHHGYTYKESENSGEHSISGKIALEGRVCAQRMDVEVVTTCGPYLHHPFSNDFPHLRGQVPLHTLEIGARRCVSFLCLQQIL